MNLFAVAVAAVLALVVTAVLGIWGIPFLKRLKFGQTILEIGPRWHKDKQGTPTMGGLLFIVGIVLGALAGYIIIASSIHRDLFHFTQQNGALFYIGLCMALAFGLIGFLDDFVKVKNKKNEGLTEKQKLVLQFIVAVGYLFSLYLMGERSTIVWVPFLGQLQLGLLYYPLAICGIVFLTNAVNFTDGIDGLCASVTAVVAIGFLIIAKVLPTGANISMQVLAAALLGGCLGFLVWNLYPAKVFMGDTGSLFLGGIVAALAFGLRMPVILIFMGLVYIIEAVTVLIQMLYFKYTRKKTGTGQRIFKMTPIHHHYEMSGWGENKIVVQFSLFQLLCCIVAVIAVIKSY